MRRSIIKSLTDFGPLLLFFILYFKGDNNLEEATIDGTPSWYTINLYYSYKLDDNFTCSLGIKNIFDMHYKTFGSGLSASGRNFILSLYSNF